MEKQMRSGVLLGTVGAVLALYFSLETDRPVDMLKPGAGTPLVAEVQPEPRAMTVDDTVLAMLPMLERPDVDARLSALDAIDEAMDDTEKGALTPDVREQAAKAVIAAFESTPAETPEGLEVKKTALQLVVTRLGGEAGRAFAGELLGSATSSWTLETLHAWLKAGAVSGQIIREKAADLIKTELVPDALKPVVLRKALGKKSEPEIVALMNTAIGRGALGACAVELQNLGKPELLGGVLSRLEEAGMLDDHKKLPWISGKLLAGHIRLADDAQLKRALKVVYLRPGLARQTMHAVKERANHPSPDVRRLVARIIPDAVKSEGIDVQSGEELLLARLKEETDPAVKGEIEGSLAEVRKTRPAPEATPTTPANP